MHLKSDIAEQKIEKAFVPTWLIKFIKVFVQTYCYFFILKRFFTINLSCVNLSRSERKWGFNSFKIKKQKLEVFNLRNP